MNFKLISCKEVIYKVVRDLGLGDKEIPWQDIIEWSCESLQQIDAYTQYEEKIGVEIEIENHMATLPMNFYAPMDNAGLVYKIQGDAILTEKKNGKIKFNYLAFILDDEGFLMIPDNISYREAILWKIAYKLAMRGELSGTYGDVAYCERKWNFYCTQARSKGNGLGIDAIEKFAKNRLRLVNDYTQYHQSFNRVQNPYNFRK